MSRLLHTELSRANHVAHLVLFVLMILVPHILLLILNLLLLLFPVALLVCCGVDSRRLSINHKLRLFNQAAT